MSDRELLELAAKAAGLRLSEYQTSQEGAPLWLDREHANPVTHSRDWSPLTDDGDALRLAVRLHIDIEIYNACVEAVWIDEAPSESHTVVEYCDEEFEGVAAKEAATRRAIVRAAAEIGKGVVAQLSGKDLPEDDYYKSQAEAFYGDKP